MSTVKFGKDGELRIQKTMLIVSIILLIVFIYIILFTNINSRIIPLLTIAILIIVAKAISPYIASAIGAQSSKLFYPDRTLNDDPIYSQAVTLKKQGKYNKAIELFEDIRSSYPAELKPHFELLDIYLNKRKSVSKAKNAYFRALKDLIRDKDKEYIKRFYKE